nr:hypothetical protein [Saccharopolyspora elongata]
MVEFHHSALLQPHPVGKRADFDVMYDYFILDAVRAAVPEATVYSRRFLFNRGIPGKGNSQRGLLSAHQDH